jgi:hypothetical protein
MGRTFFSSAPPFIVNLGGGDVAVAQELLDLADINAGIKEQGGRSSAQGMGTVEPRAFLDRPRKPRHVAGDDAIHAGLAHGLVAKLVAVDRTPGPKNRSRLQARLCQVFGERLCCGEMNTNGAVLVAFLINRERGLLAVLMEVLDPQPAGGGEPDAGVEVGLEDGAVAEIEYLVASRKAHQLAGAGRSQRSRAFEGVGRFAGDELGVGRIGDVDGQAQFGGGAGQVFVEARERGDAAVEGLGGLGRGQHGVTPALDIGDRGEQQAVGVPRPAKAEELDETQDIAAVGALGMGAGAAGDPAFKQFGDATIEAFGPRPDLRGEMAGQDRREFVGCAQHDQVPLVCRAGRCGLALLVRPFFHKKIIRPGRRGSSGSWGLFQHPASGLMTDNE